ncbi:hypothetical protein [Pontibacter oryzae]|uniref:Secreted protein n=1 Tax=Pontibacter oryzae TaxID=2304593 RepID=A0A399S1Z8_9BACT|nr:hypothetical protein [Pontibacter oryzae]RIJ37281.1 hypothetical protein D1627_09070 [Pontibacter oryzae]
MKKVIFMLFAMGAFTFATSCDSPASEREDVIEESQDLADERAEGDADDIAEERRELGEEVDEYQEELQEADTTTVIE